MNGFLDLRSLDGTVIERMKLEVVLNDGNTRHLSWHDKSTQL
jgi:hypothetical protein